MNRCPRSRLAGTRLRVGVSGPTHLVGTRSTGLPSPVPGSRSSVPNSPWSSAFLTPSGPPDGWLCSTASSVLCRCLTSRGRARRASALPSPTGPSRQRAYHGLSRFSCMDRPRSLGVYDSAGTRHVWRWRHASFRRSFRDTRPAPRRIDFGAPYPAYVFPFPTTLRCCPYGFQRMVRGHDGSLLLSCGALTSPNPCRFIPATRLVHLWPVFVICPAMNRPPSSRG